MERTEKTKFLDEMEFNLSDFALFLSVMKNKIAYENTLSIITDDPDLELQEVHVEHVILNRSGKRAIRLDAWALDTKNRQFNTEMQNDTDTDDIRRRSRFYQGLIDTPILKSGKETKYRHLPSTMIIFITQEDIFGHDLTKYTFTEQCEEISGLHLEDGTTKVFLNMSSRNGRPELVSLLQYMKDSRLDNPNISIMDERILKLAEIVDEVKQSEEWEETKMSILSIGIEKGREEGREEGERKSKIDDILNFLSDFGSVPDDLRETIFSQTDISTLSQWLKKAARSSSIEEFTENITKQQL